MRNGGTPTVGILSKKGSTSFMVFPRTMGKYALISHASKVVMLKLLQARLQQYMNQELPDVQAGFRKGRGPEFKLPTLVGSFKKQGSSRKTSTSASLPMPKPLIYCGSQETVEKF